MLLRLWFRLRGLLRKYCCQTRQLGWGNSILASPERERAAPQRRIGALSLHRLRMTLAGSRAGTTASQFGVEVATRTETKAAASPAAASAGTSCTTRRFRTALRPRGRRRERLSSCPQRSCCEQRGVSRQGIHVNSSNRSHGDGALSLPHSEPPAAAQRHDNRAGDDQVARLRDGPRTGGLSAALLKPDG